VLLLLSSEDLEEKPCAEAVGAVNCCGVADEFPPGGNCIQLPRPQS
jgi:hypothetical protein